MKSVKVDTVSLSDTINSLEHEIVNFEDNELNLFSKILSLKNIWNDGYSTSFYEKIEEEKRLVTLLIQDLRNFNNIYLNVCNNTSKYGKKLQVDFNSLSGVLSNYNSCKQYFSTINSLYNNLDLRDCSDVANKILNQKAKFINTNRLLDNYINKLNNIINNLKNMENQVSMSVFKLNITGIKSIDFYNLPTFDSSTKMVGMTSTEDIENALSNIKVDIDLESEIMNKMNNIFVTIRNYYISNMNSKNINNKQLDFNCQFKVIKSNHENLLLYVNKLKEAYLELAKITVNNVEKDIKKVA